MLLLVRISNGNNAYFVRTDNIGTLKQLSVREGYVKSNFRESRDPQGQLTHISVDERMKTIEGLSVYDVEKDAIVKISTL